MDYGIQHDGRIYTPNQTPAITVAENDARNQAIERAELARWRTAPDRAVAYYHFGDDVTGAELSVFRLPNSAMLRGAEIRTWTGAKLGAIISARVYRSNFGGRMVAIRAVGSNGAEYYGRASWDGGTAIRLRKCRERK